MSVEQQRLTGQGPFLFAVSNLYVRLLILKSSVWRKCFWDAYSILILIFLQQNSLFSQIQTCAFLHHGYPMEMCHLPKRHYRSIPHWRIPATSDIIWAQHHTQWGVIMMKSKGIRLIGLGLFPCAVSLLCSMFQLLIKGPCSDSDLILDIWLITVSSLLPRFEQYCASSFWCLRVNVSTILFLICFTLHFVEPSTCISPPNIANGVVSPNEASSPVNTSLTYTCNIGYHLSATTYSVSCENNVNEEYSADWSGTPPVCGKVFLLLSPKSYTLIH